VFIEQDISKLPKINSVRENHQEQNIIDISITKNESDCPKGLASHDATLGANPLGRATASPEAEDKQPTERKFEIFLSNLLKYGVFIASTVVLIGGLFYLIDCGGEPARYNFFLGEPSILCSPTGILTAVLSGNCSAIIQLGLLLLIATPIIRVIVSLITFLWRRDFIYVIITSLVLAGLVYSTIGAYSG
jgi:uncharacterized membrane protein